MFVHKNMTPGITTLEPDTSAADALEMLRKGDYEGLPVVENRELLGVITQHDILVALSNNPHETYLADTPVRELMTENVQTIGEDDIVEEAAYIMREHDYSLLPVVNNEGEYVGVISQSDVYEVFIEMLGLRKPGTRITLFVEDKVGVLADIAAVIKQNGISIASVATQSAEQGQMARVVVRLKTIDAHQVVEGLRAAGYRVEHVSQVWR
jgi:acetoin utilization protein AcuB